MDRCEDELLDEYFSEADLIAEISAIVGDLVPERPAGCVDCVQMMEAWGVSEYTAKDRLRKAVAAGKLETMLVRDPERGNQSIRVWRRVK